MIALNEKQEEALQSTLGGENILVTGPGGTGKSEFLKEVKRHTARNSIQPTAWTASTGISAINIGATTLHQWAGLGIHPKPISKMLDDMRQYRNKKKARDRILHAHKLIIDEISMISLETIQQIDELFRAVRKIDAPFGGIQVVFVGDFLQLPPITQDGDPEFAFMADAWGEANIRTIEFNEIFRQKNSEFTEILNRIRKGDISQDVQEYLLDLMQQKPDKNNPPVILHSHNQAAQDMNEKRLASISGKTMRFHAKDEGPESIRNQLDRNCIAPTTLGIKEDSRVMLLRNLDIDAGLINGSCGRIKKLDSEGPIVEFDNGRVRQIGPETWDIEEGGRTIASRKQIPLRLAWAITVHKSQSMTLSSAQMNLYNSFEAGQVYTALSRVKDPSGLFLTGIRFEKIRANPKALAFYGY
jgi:ATP-dependent exoDNAse (exonuclease V) alpha subunit